jgi:hypothetical protein
MGWTAAAPKATLAGLKTARWEITMIRSLCGLVNLGVLACLSLSAHAQILTPQEIEAQWVGKPQQGVLPNGRDFSLFFQPGGAISIAGAAAQDTGTWRLSESGYCIVWKNIRAGTERCFTVRRLASGEMQVLNPDGSVSGTIAKSN